MISDWFRSLRDPNPSASGPIDRDSKNEDSKITHDSNNGANVASLRGEDGPGQRTNSERGFGGETSVCFTSRRGLNVWILAS